jgi:hypothetical protein
VVRSVVDDAGGLVADETGDGGDWTVETDAERMGVDVVDIFDE